MAYNSARPKGNYQQNDNDTKLSNFTYGAESNEELLVYQNEFLKYKAKYEKYKAGYQTIVEENAKLEHRLQSVEEVNRQQRRKIEDLKLISMQNTSEQYPSYQYKSQEFRLCFEDDKKQLKQLLEKLSTQMEYSFQRREDEMGMIDQLIAESKQAMAIDLEKSETIKNELHETCDQKISELERNIDIISAEKAELEHRELTVEKSAKDLLKHTEDLQTKLEHLTHENDVLSSKLSAEMSDKMSSNETDVENITIKNRPLNIGDQYRQICSTEWLEAKTAIDDERKSHSLYTFSEEDAFKFLYQIFLISETKAVEMLNKHRSAIYSLLLDPVDKRTAFGIQDPDESKIPQKVKIVIGDFMRSSAERTNLKELAQDVESAAYSHAYRLKHCYTIKGVISDYISAVTKLSWNMVNQRPMMSFDKQEKQQYNPQLHDLQWGSADPSIENCYMKLQVTPVLCHGDCVMAKGKVFMESVNSKVYQSKTYY